VLLDMIRGADVEDEEKIVSALYNDDPEFFEEVTNRLLGDDLIPYMDSREISSVLMRATDEILVSMRTQSPSLIASYRKLISKRRYETIMNLPIPDDTSIDENKSVIWQYIEDYFRTHKERVIYARDKDVRLKTLSSEPEYKSIIAQKYSSDILSSDSELTIQSIKPGLVEVNVAVGLKNLHLYARLSSGIYVGKYYSHIRSGVLEVPMDFVANTIICGALTMDNKLVESISFLKKEVM